MTALEFIFAWLVLSLAVAYALTRRLRGNDPACPSCRNGFDLAHGYGCAACGRHGLRRSDVGDAEFLAAVSRGRSE